MRDQARWCTRTSSRLEIQTVCAWKHALMRERKEKLSVALRSANAVTLHQLCFKTSGLLDAIVQTFLHLLGS